MRKIYLDNYDLEQAIEQYYLDIKDNITLETVEIATKNSLNYISSEAVYAQISVPNYNASAMDGVAVKSSETSNASENRPLFLTKDQYCAVDTGDVINSEFDAVVMIEDLVKDDNESIMLSKAVAYFENIRPIGEDITQTQMILPSFQRIRAVDIGPMIASKNETISVFKKLKVGIIPTGTEIVDVTTAQLEDGMIIDSNSSMIKSLASEMMLEAYIYPIIEDDYQLLKDAIQKVAQEVDVILINAGSSAGSEDYTVRLLEELGEVSVHGIAIKPGKPAILGRIDQTIVLGLPGYPVATYIVFEQVFKPIIERLYHQENKQEKVWAKLSKTIYSSLKHLEFVRVKIGYVNNEFVCTPLARGAGVSMSLSEADGMVVITKNAEGILKGEQVEVKLFKPPMLLKDKLTIIGSHDLILDVLQDAINIKGYPTSLSSSHVGSYAGLLALKAKECNIAPIHILASDGTYNVEIVKELFPNERMALIKGVKRRQVLAFLAENPRQISSINDVVQRQLKYVNRQAGSGTAILLDYLLEQNNLTKEQINGYDFVMPSHFNVAAAIKNQTADCGLVIKSVADVLGLDYIEVLSEEYDFLIYQHDLANPKIQMFIEVLQDDIYKNKLAEFASYDSNNSGNIIEIR